jgi:hypothetical protein
MSRYSADEEKLAALELWANKLRSITGDLHSVLVLRGNGPAAPKGEH